MEQGAQQLQAVELTVDHKPDNPEERARIEAAGGTVTDARPDGTPARVEHRDRGLAMSRSIGDKIAKEVGVTRAMFKAFRYSRVPPERAGEANAR